MSDLSRHSVIETSETTKLTWVGTTAIALGLVLLFAVGFAGPTVLHNAAHDARHAIAFPCH